MVEFSRYKVFFQLMVFPLIFLFAGCAGAPSSETLAKQKIGNDSKQSSVKAHTEENQKIVPERPEIELSKELLFKIIVA